MRRRSTCRLNGDGVMSEVSWERRARVISVCDITGTDPAIWGSEERDRPQEGQPPQVFFCINKEVDQ